mgnify:CR=1 FL=1
MLLTILKLMRAIWKKNRMRKNNSTLLSIQKKVLLSILIIKIRKEKETTNIDLDQNNNNDNEQNWFEAFFCVSIALYMRAWWLYDWFNSVFWYFLFILILFMQKKYSFKFQILPMMSVVYSFKIKTVYIGKRERENNNVLHGWIDCQGKPTNNC